jgi:hypothetical protein
MAIARDSLPLENQSPGDMDYYSGSGEWVRLPIGTDGQFLIASNQGVLPRPGWATLTHGNLTARTMNMPLPLSNFVAVSGTPVLAAVGSDASFARKVQAWAFDGAANEYIQYNGLIRTPRDYTSGVYTLRIYWSASDTTVANVLWQAVYSIVDSGNQIDEAETAVNGLTATIGTADQELSTDFALGTPTDTNTGLRIIIARIGADALDTYNALDAWITGVELLYSSQ